MSQELLDEAVKRLYERLESLGGDPSRLPALLQPVAILYTVQAMIDNGGFPYFFESDMPSQPPYSVVINAYRTIGASDAADCLEAAVALFPFQDPERNEAARNEYMNEMGEDHEFVLLGMQVCGDQRVWTRMEEYVAQHRQAFFED